MNKNDEQSMNENYFDTVMKKYHNIRMNPEEKREVFKQTMLVIEKIQAVSLAHSDLHKATRPTSAFVEDESLISFKTNSNDATIDASDNGRIGNGNRNFKRVTSIWFSYIKQRQFVPALLTAFVFLFTGGTSVLAEKSLPGDSLYSFKVNVNEPIRELATVGTEAKAKLAVEVTERRLQEATVLSVQGKLDESNKKILQDQFSKNASQIHNQVASLVSNNNLDAAQEIFTDLETTLNAHSKILGTLAGGSDNSATGSITIIIATGTDATSTPIEEIPLNLNTASSGEPITAINPLPIIVEVSATTTPPASTTITASTPTSPSAPSTPVNSLLKAVQAELNTTKNARIGIEEQTNATLAKTLADSTDQSNTATKSVIESTLQGIRFTMDDILKEIDASKFDSKAFVYSSDTIKFAKQRLENASSSINKIAALSKGDEYAEAVKLGRAISRSLSEVLVILKIEKSTKGSLGGKVDITSLIKNSSDWNNIGTSSTSKGL